MSISEKRIFRSYGMITMGTFLMALGTCLIYEPMSMVTGGFSGVGIVLEKLFGIPVFAVTFLLWRENSTQGNIYFVRCMP